MTNYMRLMNKFLIVVVSFLVGTMGTASWAQDFDELKVFIEMNATDGDVGFHVLLDAEAWKEVKIRDPRGKKLFKEMVKRNLREQGLTENFFESAEPLCLFDPEEPDEEVVSLAEFLERFPAGNYRFSGKTIERGKLRGTEELTHNLPAAPVDLAFDGASISWAAGSDLGEKCHDEALVTDGVIPDPATVVIVGWEVVLEPEDDELLSPNRVFSVQLPADATSVTVPPEFLDSLVDEGVTEFKFEVGAIEASGNQTFSEETFEIEDEEP